MPVELRLPDIGEGMQEGEIVKWLVKEGERVAEDQPVVEVQTDKVVAEIPAPTSGTVDKILTDVGSVVPVGEVILRISAEGEAKQLETGASERKLSNLSETTFSEEDVSGNADNVQSKKGSALSNVRRALAAPATRRLARKLKVDIEQITGTGPRGRVLAEDVRRAAAEQHVVNGHDRSKLPDAETGKTEQLHADYIHGGGNSAATIPDRDVTAPHTAGQLNNMVGYTPEAIHRESVQALSHSVKESPLAEKLAFTGLRGVIAKNMVQSAFTIPHVTHFDEADVTELIRVREHVKKKAAARGAKLTYVPFFMKSIVVALQEFPVFNATWSEDGKEVWMHKTYNIGVAVDTEEGLVVPVVRDVNRKSIISIAREIESLVEKARRCRLTRDEMSGGTFTVSNVGPVGGLFATPIIRYPEVALMAFHKIKPRPAAVIEDGERKVVVRDMMNVSVSFDHRVADGVAVVRFTNRILELLESPEDLLIELV